MGGEAHSGTSRGARHLNDDINTGNARDEDRGSQGEGPSSTQQHGEHTEPFGEVQQGARTGFGHPLSFQGEGFFNNGVPFQHSPPHIGVGNAVGYGGGRRSASAAGGGFRGRGPKDYRRSDERIAEDVNDQLTVDDDIDAGEITVSVAGGEVTLAGTVHSRSEKRRAEDLADQVAGVTHVQNNLRVKPRT